MKIANECGQKWYRWSSWFLWIDGGWVIRPLYSKLQDGSGFAIGPIMVFTKK